ncbi:class I SAM-dependent rRNA methyltransferase [Roseospira marina]|uniref:Class I SAM-dependent rRNA methyltransferase n=1 Tax=Roseospira marina TaxID=140057 RepID=A0A5M6I9T1_9PROT|nr:class I SAM-dependent rRNA methyltransferase [Roseospira marina]KAA5604717.1 class I SAM-dependent rRNA methyltransferase [Roseospira marina]MBB4315165.1 23S rRNA (cytosine1962-C5)-methyltransferase [Roseospira marina]MBB5088065.1 23S rRNA (cytosine1962-C5)-methyltransferase [Roseospira marina]
MTADISPADAIETTPAFDPAQPPHPRVVLKAGQSKRLRRGHPWVYSNEVEMTPAAKALPPGTVVTVQDAGDEPLATALFNPHSLIALRVLAPQPDVAVTTALIAERLHHARTLREALVDGPFYRLAHAEADGLPGLIIDRFDRYCVVQANSAGMDRLLPQVLEALDSVVKPEGVVIRDDTGGRALDGLPVAGVRTHGTVPDGPVAVRQNGVTYRADLTGGQKTGWYFDQRDNHALVARLSKGRTVLDVFSHAGGFGLAGAAAGATSVLCVDSAAPALTLAAEAAAETGVGDRVETRQGDAFAVMAEFAREGRRFGVVVCDPPSFVKARKDLATGAKGYRKMARMAAALVEPGGVLFAASCSHNMPADRFLAEVTRGVTQAERNARILAQTGAALDHPLHPALPETAYLKGVLLALD